MTDRNEFEGIDFRVKVPKQAPQVASLLNWILGCIAIVSLSLLVVQYRSSRTDHDVLQSLRSDAEAQNKIVAALRNENNDVKQQLAQLQTTLNQTKEQLETCRRANKRPNQSRPAKPTAPRQKNVTR